jgi:hypothetical protein
MLKRKMLKLNAIIGVFYALAIISVLTYHVILNSNRAKDEKNYGNYWMHPRLTVEVLVKESVELAILALLYFNVRPRDQWPSFFSLEMHEDIGEFLEELHPVVRRGEAGELLANGLGGRGFVAGVCEASMHASSYGVTSKTYSDSMDFSLGQHSSLNTSDSSINQSVDSYHYRNADMARRAMNP